MPAPFRSRRRSAHRQRAPQGIIVCGLLMVILLATGIPNHPREDWRLTAWYAGRAPGSQSITHKSGRFRACRTSVEKEAIGQVQPAT
jgi:hypothetical protein